MDKKAIKEILGEIPFAVELYWLLRQRDKQLKSRFSLKSLQASLPDIMDQVRPFAEGAPKNGKHILIFSNLHYWIEHLPADFILDSFGIQFERVENLRDDPIRLFE